MSPPRNVWNRPISGSPSLEASAQLRQQLLAPMQGISALDNDAHQLGQGSARMALGPGCASSVAKSMLEMGPSREEIAMYMKYKFVQEHRAMKAVGFVRLLHLSALWHGHP